MATRLSQGTSEVIQDDAKHAAKAVGTKSGQRRICPTCCIEE